MARLAIADAVSWCLTHPVSHAAFHRARILDCRALDALDGLALGDPPRFGSLSSGPVKCVTDSPCSQTLSGRQLPAPQIHIGLNPWFDLADDSALSINVSITLDKRLLLFTTEPRCKSPVKRSGDGLGNDLLLPRLRLSPRIDNSVCTKIFPLALQSLHTSSQLNQFLCVICRNRRWEVVWALRCQLGTQTCDTLFRFLQQPGLLRALFVEHSQLLLRSFDEFQRLFQLDPTWNALCR